MSVHPVFCNILFSPKIWGLRFTNMVFCMLSLIVGFFIGGNLGIIAKFSLTLLLSGLLYAFFYWQDNRDPVAHHARRNCRIRPVVAAYGLPAHFIRLE